MSIYGAKKWSKIAAELPGRIGKQCRERWHNHLNPDINKKPWTLEEDRLIIMVILSLPVIFIFPSHMGLLEINGQKSQKLSRVEPTMQSKTIGIHQ